MSLPKPESDLKGMTLRAFCPDCAPEEIFCDSIRITVKDDASGRKGGLYGIRTGHAPALFALEAGTAEAFLGGKSVWKRTTGEGFARVGNDSVTIVTETLCAE